MLKTSATNLCSTGREFLILTNYVKIQSFKMDSLGNTIRKLREEKELPLRTVAAFLDIDQAILSKIERRQRKPTREQVVKLAVYFKVKENDLLVAWLSDKLVYEVEDEDMALKALQVAEEKVQYITQPKISKTNIINLIKITLKKDGRVAAAWLFGSLARGDEKFKSDIDIMVEMNNAKKYSMFDLLDIAFIIENKINRKVDLVEKGYLKDFAMKTASHDLIKIYG
ncbi:MAG: nucleotidyltransferase domain-containing protein [Bacteroidota bacterium]